MSPPGPGIGPTSGVSAIRTKPSPTRDWRTSAVSVQPFLGRWPFIAFIWVRNSNLQRWPLDFAPATLQNGLRYGGCPMVAHVATVAFLGLEARGVEVQVQIASGLPKFLVVGLPDKAVGESRERVHAALAAIGLALPPKRITVNLSPADLPKEGSHYDLPIALGLLAAMGAIDRETLASYCAVGELSLDGRVAPSPGVLLAAMHASARGLGLICPADQGAEAAWAGDVEVVPATDLISLLNHLRGNAVLAPPTPGEAEPSRSGPDLNQVKGQE